MSLAASGPNRDLKIDKNGPHRKNETNTGKYIYLSSGDNRKKTKTMKIAKERKLNDRCLERIPHLLNTKKF